MLSLHAGYDVAYLTDAVGAGGVDYYLSAAGKNGEPPGVWMGKGAEALGLTGQVDAKVMRDLYHHGILPDGTEMQAQKTGRYAQEETLDEQIEAEIAEKVKALGRFATQREIDTVRLQVASKQRNAVRFFDFTLSATKSVSVLQASYLVSAKLARQDGDEAKAQHCTDAARRIEDAMRAGAGQVVYSAERGAAYVRTGHHGEGQGQWRDTAGLTAAVFMQHTSRDGDPQLHAHIAILNKAQRADGEDARWRTLDSRSLHRERLGIAAFASLQVDHQLLRAGYSLVAREDGNGSEVEGVEPATMRAFSSRRTVITPAIERLVEEYTTKHGYAPSRRALWSLRQWATLETRRSKYEVERSPAASLQVWEAQSEAAEVQLLDDVAETVERFGAARDETVQTTDEMHRAVRIAVHEVQRQNATWTAAQLSWELSRVIKLRDPATAPVDLLNAMLTAALTGQVDGVDIVPLAPAPDVTDVSMLGLRASDGRSVYRPPGEARYATADTLDMEEWLIGAARRKVGQAVSDEDATGAVQGMNGNQAETVKGLLTTRTRVTVLIGPAGSGKTYVMARYAAAWRRLAGGDVVGVAASTNAARQLASEGMTRTYNIAQFLGKIKDSDQTRAHARLSRGDVIVVDEASQVSTVDLAAIMRIAEKVGARVILTGDTAQLGSVEAGGMMAEIARHQGNWQLNEVRRFQSAWEARASLAMRSGDLKAWVDYRAHGRIRSGPQDEAYAKAVEMWVADGVNGAESLLLAGSNAEAAELARLARQRLVEWKLIPGNNEVTLSDGNDAGTGDQIRARLNTKHIKTGGRPLTNRDTLRITGWAGTGEGQVRRAVVQRKTKDGWSREFEVPVAYLESDAELAYAGNVHVAQGRTVDRGHLVVSETLSREALYTGMTRGREYNLAHVVTGPAAKGTDKEQAPPEAVIGAAMQREDQDATATQTIRDAQKWATSTRHLFELWRDLVHHEQAPVLDEAVKARVPDAEYQRYRTDPQRPIFEQQMRKAQLAGHDVAEVLDRVTGGGYEGARSIAAVLHGRVEKLGLEGGGRTSTWAERTPREAGQSPPEWSRAVQETVQALDHRQVELGARLLDKPEPWVVRYLGMPPAEAGVLRDDWMARAGIAASYREGAGHNDPEQAVGEAPVRNPELREAYEAALRALEIREVERARGVDRGELESRVKVYERAREWAPKPVGRELENTAGAEQEAATQAAGFYVGQEPAMEASARALEETLAQERGRLEVARAAREEWEELHAPERERADGAVDELRRRGIDEPGLDEAEVQAEVEPEVQAEVEQIDADLDRIRESDAARETEREIHEAEAAQYEAERASASWREAELNQPEAGIELEAEPELER